MENKSWVDQGINFIPRQIEEIGNKGIIIRRRLLSYEKIQPNIWFPKRVEEETIDSGRIINRNLYILTSVKVNSEAFPSNIFNIVFPSGTRVADRIIGNSYSVP